MSSAISPELLRCFCCFLTISTPPASPLFFTISSHCPLKGATTMPPPLHHGGMEILKSTRLVHPTKVYAVASLGCLGLCSLASSLSVPYTHCSFVPSMEICSRFPLLGPLHPFEMKRQCLVLAKRVATSSLLARLSTNSCNALRQSA